MKGMLFTESQEIVEWKIRRHSWVFHLAHKPNCQPLKYFVLCQHFFMHETLWVMEDPVGDGFELRGSGRAEVARMDICALDFLLVAPGLVARI